MPASLRAFDGSDLPLNIRKAASKILTLAEEPDQVVLVSRIKSIQAKGTAKQRVLDLPSAVKIQFEAWYLPIYFDAENPELIIRRDFTAAVDTSTLIRGTFDQGLVEWDVSDSFDTASKVGLPPEGYEKLAEEIHYVHIDAVIEWLSLGNGIPLWLSPKVRAIYEQYSDGCNDNLEDSDPAPDELPHELYDELSRRAVGVIGREVVQDLLPEQANTLDRFLGEMLEEYGSLENITDAMIVGQYEMMLAFMPADLVIALHQSEGVLDG